MAVYKFKCEGCGATQCEKVDGGYKCKYCGCVQDVMVSDSANNTGNQAFNDSNEDLGANQMSPKQKSIIIRLILCIFVGYLGVHKFFEGKILLGLVYLCTFGFFGIGILIDTVKYIAELVNAGKNNGGEQ